MIEELRNINDLNKIENYVLWFSNPKCAPCKKIKPTMINVSVKYKNIKFFKIDVDKNPDVAEKYGITSVPTIIFFKKGREVSRLSGYIRKDDVVNSLKILLGGENHG